MKKCIFIFLVLGVLQAHAQQPSNPQAQLTPQQKAMLKQMGIDPSDHKKAAEQIKQLKQQGKQPDFKAQGQNMINNMMVNSGAQTKSAGDLGYFTNNASLVPEKDIKRINSVSKKIFSDAEMLSNTKTLYGKMMAKLPAAEKSIITSVTAQRTGAEDLNKSSVAAMMQGHRLAALGLAMQAVIAKPGNLNYQNNMAALLTENGYPENAIPYLNTLQQQVPGNSTVKNNLGYAWLNLGEIDSAQRILTMAAALNPENAETKTGEGVIEEKKGNTEEAGKNYEEAYVTHPSTMGGMLLDNASKENPYDGVDFENIKDYITIYEYFKKDWLAMPTLSNSVKGYENDKQVEYDYEEVGKDLQKKFEEIKDSIKKAKDGDLFVPSEKGKVWGHILIAINAYQGKFIKNFMEDAAAYSEYANFLYEEAEKKFPSPVKCEVQDAITDNYLKQVNPMIRDFYLKRAEDFRVWLNAYITYSLLTNHQYKQHLLETIDRILTFLVVPFQCASELKALSPCEYKQNNNEPLRGLLMYKLPKLLCPVNLNSSPGINNNNTNISKSADGAVPNVTVAVGSSEGEIAEPGKGGTPAVKSSQGDVSSTGYNGQDAYQRMLNLVNNALANSNNEPQITMDEPKITPGPSQRLLSEEVDNGLKPIASQIKQEEVEITSDDAKVTLGPSQRLLSEQGNVAPIMPIAKQHSLRQWLQDQLGTDCEDLKPREQNPPPPMDIKKEMENNAKGLEEIAKQLSQQNNPGDAQRMETVKTLLDEVHKAQQCIDKKSQADPGWADKYVQSTVSPTINNGLQTPGSNPTLIKGLFN